MEERIVLEVKNVAKTFYVMDKHASMGKRVLSLINPKKHAQRVEALKAVNFKVFKGDFLGIIGENGSGKSTLLKIIIGYIDGDEGGSVKVSGRLTKLALGMAFDDALTARDNIYLNGSIFGLTFDEIRERFDEIVKYAEVEQFINTPLRFYSSGMRSRLALSIALHAEADIFLIDEFFGEVGDIGFKAKSNNIFNNRIANGKTILFVSHFMNLIEKYCNRLLVIDKGNGYLFENVQEGLLFYKNQVSA